MGRVRNPKSKIRNQYRPTCHLPVHRRRQVGFVAHTRIARGSVQVQIRVEGGGLEQESSGGVLLSFWGREEAVHEDETGAALLVSQEERHGGHIASFKNLTIEVSLPHLRILLYNLSCRSYETTGGKRMEMSMVSRRALTEKVRQRYALIAKAVKTKILDEFVANTGYNRKYAIHLITHPPRPQAKKQRRRQRTYTDTIVQALTFIWQVCGCICSKRLKPFLPEMASVLERLGHLHLSGEDRQLLVKISRSTIDRLLAPARKRLQPRGRSTTKPGTLLKKAIPIRTFADWNEDGPGFLEIDLVAHCGESTSGDYLCTLDTVDIATCWSECIIPVNRGQHAVHDAIKEIRQRLPFPLLGIDSDNDGSFIMTSCSGIARRRRSRSRAVVRTRRTIKPT